jgi:hypothetical protein
MIFEKGFFLAFMDEWREIVFNGLIANLSLKQILFVKDRIKNT